MEHGSGGQATGDLIEEVFAAAFQDETLNQMEDSAVVPGPDSTAGSKLQWTAESGAGGAGKAAPGRLAVTTDSFVVTPLEFRGGDIGRLSVCGTVNDLLMRGAVPKYLTCGFILEEGLETDTLRRVVSSMAATAREAGVHIVAGDTKVVEAHAGGYTGDPADHSSEIQGAPGLYINTTGIGFVPDGLDISAANSEPGDAILVSGTMGDHHAAILSERLQIETDIESDCAPLADMVGNMVRGGIHVHTLRDVTRGGLGTVLKELAEASQNCFVIDENAVPVTRKVRDFCGLLGLDPLYMGNEGKMIATVPMREAERALQILRSSKYGKDAALIGQVVRGKTDILNASGKSDSGQPEADPSDVGELYMRTEIGGLRRMDVLQGEGLPRIC